MALSKHIPSVAALFHFAMNTFADTPSVPHANPAAPQRNPVLLVHGIHDSARSMHRMGEYLNARGWRVNALDLVPNNGDAGIDDMAAQVARFVREKIPMPLHPLMIHSQTCMRAVADALCEPEAPGAAHRKPVPAVAHGH